MGSEEQHATALIAALTTLQAHPKRLSDAKASNDEFYTEVIAIRRFGGTQRGSGSRSGQLYRAFLRQVAKNDLNASRLRAKSAGLEGMTLSIAGLTTTPIEFETAEPIGEDAGWFSGAETWTYALI